MKVIIVIGNDLNKLNFIDARFKQLEDVREWVFSLSDFLIHIDIDNEFCNRAMENMINIDDDIHFDITDNKFLYNIYFDKFKYSDAIYDVINNDFDLMMWFEKRYISIYYRGELSTQITRYLDKFCKYNNDNSEYMGILSYCFINNSEPFIGDFERLRKCLDKCDKRYGKI